MLHPARQRRAGWRRRHRRRNSDERSDHMTAISGHAALRARARAIHKRSTGLRGAALTALVGLVVACGGQTPTTTQSSGTPFNVLIVGALTGATGALGAACTN